MCTQPNLSEKGGGGEVERRISRRIHESIEMQKA